LGPLGQAQVMTQEGEEKFLVSEEVQALRINY